MTLSFPGRSGTGSADGSASTVAAAYSSANAAGGLSVVHVSWVDTDGTFNVNSVTDTQNNQYFAVDIKSRNATQQYATQIWYAFGIKAGANTVTANFSAATTFRRIGVEEVVSSVGSFWRDPLDQINKATGNSNAPNAGNVTPQRNDELVMACAAIGSGTLAAGTGYTLRTVPGANVAMEGQIQTTATTVSGDFTNGVSAQWCAQVATFRDVEPPPQYVPIPPPYILQLILIGKARDVQLTPEPVSGVFGTGVADLGALTATATGGRTVLGVAASTLGGLTATAAGAPVRSGTAVADLGGLTATASGTVTVPGAAAASLGGTLATATGTRTVFGTASSTTSLTATAAGTPTVVGTGTASLGGLVAAGQGTVTIPGAAAGVLGALTATATALRTVHATGQALLGPLTGHGQGTGPAAITGTGIAVLGGLTGIAAGVRTTAGTGTAALGPLVGTAVGHGNLIHPPNTGTITRPNTGTITRPSTGTITRPSTGLIIKPDEGQILRP